MCKYFLRINDMVLWTSFCFLVSPSVHTMFLWHSHAVPCLSASRYSIAQFHSILLVTPSFPPPPAATNNLQWTCSHMFPYRSGGAAREGAALLRHRHTDTLHWLSVARLLCSVSAPNGTSTRSMQISMQPWLYPTFQFQHPIVCQVIQNSWFTWNSLISEESEHLTTCFFS